MNILGTGLSGLVGSRVVAVQSQHVFENLDLSVGVDILNESQVRSAIEKSSAQVVVHFAAFTDTAKAFAQHGDKTGPAYMVNVIGTQNVARAAKEAGKYFIHISTSYVFDGKKEQNYTETDVRCPIEWYGMTKSWAEEQVESIGGRYAILRIDRPYHFDSFSKLDLLHKVKKQLEEGSLLPQFSDTRWNPTNIDRFAAILMYFASKQPENGIYHTTTEPEYSDYSFAQWVNEYYRLQKLVVKGSLTEYLATHDRPYQRNTSLSTAKLQQLLIEAS